MAMPKVIKRACDRCHARKVKCNGIQPCVTCEQTQSSCSFQNPILPKGPTPKSDPNGRARPRTSDASSPPRHSPHRRDLQAVDTTFDDPWQLQDDIATWVQESSQPELDYDLVHDWSSFPETPMARASPDRPGEPSSGDRARPPLTAGTPQISSSSDTLPLQLLPPTTSMDFPDFETIRFPPEQTYNNFSMFGSSGIFPPTMPWEIPIAPPEDISPIFSLTLETLIKPQLEIFFDRIYPMLPIFSRATIFARLTDPELSHNATFVALILSMVSLSLIHPLMPEEMPLKATRAKQCKTLMDEACRLRGKWDYGCRPSVEAATTSYLMFGTLFELGQAQGSRVRLKEAIGMGEMMELDSPKSYVGLDRDELHRRMRLFWVLAVTERAYALQRSGKISFEGNILLPHLITPDHYSGDAASQALRHLAHVFSFIDQDIISCWNGRCDPLTCSKLTRSRVILILAKLKGTAGHVFGNELDLAGLSEVQKADLLITWQWLRNRIWRLAACHGLTCEGEEFELSAEYVVDVATKTVAICKRLSARAMEAHGTGFVEKLYDIASIVTELLGSQPSLQDRLIAVAQTDHWTELLRCLSFYVTRHGAGISFAAPMAQVMSVVSTVKMLLPAPV